MKKRCINSNVLQSKSSMVAQRQYQGNRGKFRGFPMIKSGGVKKIMHSAYEEICVPEFHKHTDSNGLGTPMKGSSTEEILWRRKVDALYLIVLFADASHSPLTCYTKGPLHHCVLSSLSASSSHNKVSKYSFLLPRSLICNCLPSYLP